MVSEAEARQGGSTGGSGYNMAGTGGGQPGSRPAGDAYVPGCGGGGGGSVGGSGTPGGAGYSGIVIFSIKQ